MAFYLLALLIGVVAGLRAMTAPAAVSWGAWLGWIPLQGTPLAFMGFAATPWILTLMACAEFVTDQLPRTPSRKVPVQFGTRLLTGALSGACIGAASQMLVAGLVLGAIGAAIGTYGGAAARANLARAFGRDWPAAVLEDMVAVGGAAYIILELA